MNFRNVMLGALALVAASAASIASHAQYRDDRRPWSDDRGGGRDDNRGQNVAGDFDYYALVLSWSPTYCATADRQRDELQCDRRDGRRYAFVLHGLWPQYERGYPESCRTRRKPFVSQEIIDGMLDIMPSPALVIHEYRKHGTCSGLEPAGYYSLSRQLFQSIRIPQQYINPFETLFVSPGQLVSEFLKVNPQLKPGSIAVACGGTGNRLKELRICLTRQGAPRDCGRNEDQRRLCSANKMFVPPVRSAAAPPGVSAPRPPANKPPSTGQRPDSLPGPRLIERDKGI